jgi:hypothetical protein
VNAHPESLTKYSSSKKKMGQVVFRILAEAGYLKNTRKLELQRVIVRAELRSLLDVHSDTSIDLLMRCL